jgi:hypothetical protein
MNHHSNIYLLKHASLDHQNFSLKTRKLVLALFGSLTESFLRVYIHLHLLPQGFQCTVVAISRLQDLIGRPMRRLRTLLLLQPPLSLLYYVHKRVQHLFTMIRIESRWLRAISRCGPGRASYSQIIAIVGPSDIFVHPLRGRDALKAVSSPPTPLSTRGNPFSFKNVDNLLKYNFTWSER